MPLAQQAIDRGLNLVMFPEYSTTPAIVEALLAGRGGVLAELAHAEQEQCRRVASALKQMVVVCGSHLQADNGRTYNACPVAALGQVHYQRKLQVTDPERAAGISGGEELLLFAASGWGNFAVIICYDFTAVHTLRPALQGKIDLLLVITCNRDAQNFARLAEFESLPLHAYVAVVNVSDIGGSIVAAPVHGDKTELRIAAGNEELHSRQCRLKELARSRAGEKAGNFRVCYD